MLHSLAPAAVYDATVIHPGAGRDCDDAAVTAVTNTLDKPGQPVVGYIVYLNPDGKVVKVE